MSANEVSLRWLSLGTLAGGAPLRVPIHTFRGSAPGPTVGISAGIHGDEIQPIEVVRRLAGMLHQSELAGTVHLLPVANPLAFAGLSRHTPQDQLNLNRVFPGDPNGWLTEQMAHAIAGAFLPGLAALLDLHAGGLFPTVDYVYILNDEALSRALGVRVMFRTPRGFAGTLGSLAVEQGVPTVVAELGGGQIADERYLTRALDGVCSALRRLGVLPGAPAPHPEPLITERLETLRPHQGGLLVPEVRVPDLGSVVPRGTLLGRVYDPYTFVELERFEAPFARTILILLRGAVSGIQIGDYAYMVGEA
ncbi:MAG TPA: succinylglutamate desuccinylase/aspartoacylase family protein [Thermomicrobiaceae bacterium]|nr:succinylglutamate desuccinylase/aspartoacylase family protein [Thermomicrobiaceae bacterium]